MTAVVADTHTIIWYLQASKQLSAQAVLALEQATQSGNFNKQLAHLIGNQMC